MKILFCYTRLPWPIIRGDQLTVFKLLEFLVAHHEVDFLCVTPDDPTDLARLPRGGRHFEGVHNRLPGRLSRIARGLVGGRCLQIESFYPPTFGVARDRLLASNKYDIVYSHYIRSFGHENFDSRGAKKVIGLQLSHQAHYSKAAENARNLFTRWLYRVEARRLRNWEGRIAGWNDLVHLISPRDQSQIVGNESWRERVFFNPHGVDESIFVPAPWRRVSGRVVFTGNLSFQANEDAVCWLCGEIWPAIVRQCPEATLVVAGANPTFQVRQAVARASRASLLANPEHMWEVIQTAEVAVDPLRIGAGLQNKILEALSCGVPVVSTFLGNEGIGAVDGAEIVLADVAEPFSAEVVRLLQDGTARARLSETSRRFIERAWSWEHHFNLLDERWQALVISSAAIR